MAQGVDESAFLGSAVSSVSSIPTSESVKENDERIKKVVAKRKETYAALGNAIETLEPILAKEIEKESSLDTVRERAQKRSKAEGSTQREALSDELLYSAGRLDAFNTIAALFAAVKQERASKGEK